jgi:hypothetical protein
VEEVLVITTARGAMENMVAYIKCSANGWTTDVIGSVTKEEW